MWRLGKGTHKDSKISFYTNLICRYAGVCMRGIIQKNISFLHVTAIYFPMKNFPCRGIFFGFINCLLYSLHFYIRHLRTILGIIFPFCFSSNFCCFGENKNYSFSCLFPLEIIMELNVSEGFFPETLF